MGRVILRAFAGVVRGGLVCAFATKAKSGHGFEVLKREKAKQK